MLTYVDNVVKFFYLLTVPKLCILSETKIQHWNLQLPANTLEYNIPVYLNHTDCKYLMGFQWDVVNSVKAWTIQ